MGFWFWVAGERGRRGASAPSGGEAKEHNHTACQVLHAPPALAQVAGRGATQYTGVCSVGFACLERIFP